MEKHLLTSEIEEKNSKLLYDAVMQSIYFLRIKQKHGQQLNNKEINLIADKVTFWMREHIDEEKVDLENPKVRTLFDARINDEQKRLVGEAISIKVQSKGTPINIPHN